MRLEEWGQIFVFGFLAQGFGALSFFLFGLAAVRHGAIDGDDFDPGARESEALGLRGLVDGDPEDDRL